MKIPTPHFFLYSQAHRENDRDEWSFVLKAADGSAELRAADAEPSAHGERLELLAVVRGLEALDQPSRVTLITPSQYVKHGMSYGLPEWGRNGWKWEHFGEMVPVKNQDLWQRLDRALKIHRIAGTSFRVDKAHTSISALPVTASAAQTSDLAGRHHVHWAAHVAQSAGDLSAWLRDKMARLKLWCAQLGTSLLPCPWLE